MKIWRRVKVELWWLAHGERGDKGGGSAPEQREQTPEEKEQVALVNQLYRQQIGYGGALQPWELGGRQYEIALQTGQGYPGIQFGGAGGGGIPTGVPGQTVLTAPGGMPGGAGTGGLNLWGITPGMSFTQARDILARNNNMDPREAQDMLIQVGARGGANVPIDARVLSSLSRAGGAGAPGAAGVPATIKPRAGAPGSQTSVYEARTGLPAPRTGGTTGGRGPTPDWYQNLARQGGTMGMEAQQNIAQGMSNLALIPQRGALESTQLATRKGLASGAGAPGGYGALGTPYGSSLEMKGILNQIYQDMQNRGMYGSGVVPALGVEAGARVAERKEGASRDEKLRMLGLGLGG